MPLPVALAFDTSQARTGWSVLSRDMKAPVFGAFSPNLPEYKKLAELRCLIGRLYEQYGVTHIGYEFIFIDLSKFLLAGRMAQCRMQGVVMEMAGALGLPDPYELKFAQWRNEFLGHSKAPPGLTKPADRRKYWKQEVLKECARREWWGITYDDEAEAIGMAHTILVDIDDTYAARTAPIFRRTQMQADRKALVK